MTTKTINHHGDQELRINHSAMDDAINKRLRYWENADLIHVYMNPPSNSGFLEWGVDIWHNNKRVIFMGAIQRTPDSPVEFHS